MFRALSNIPIFRRLAFTFAIATLIPILVILLLGNFSLQSSAVRSQAVQTSFDAQNIATKEQINLERMNALLQARFAQIFAQHSPALGGDPSLQASGALTGIEVANLELDFSQSLVSYKQSYELATSPNMSTILAILMSDAPDHGDQVRTAQQAALDAVSRTEWTNYQTWQDRALEDLAVNDPPYESSYFDFYQANLYFLPLKNDWQRVVDAATQMGTTVTQVGPSLIDPLLIYTGIALIFTLLVITAAGALINITIISPLRGLVSLTRQVAQGDTRARAAIRGRDEINQVASSMNGMLDNIVHLIQEAQARHADLQEQIEHMIGEVSGVGEGNLQIQLQVTSNELGVLADSFNVMAEQLSTLVINVKSLAHGVQGATLQAFGYMEQLVDTTDIQIQQITQAADEVSQVAVSSRQIAERTQVLFNVAYDARQAVQRGRRATQQTVSGMEHINETVSTTSKKVLSLEERSREISSIVEVISSIAQQTNRLALDASIQAAMAGDNGKGFGAVAVDIRRLAERAKEQSALVIQIVRNVLVDIGAATYAMQDAERETSAGMQVTQDVGRALEQLFSAVEHQAGEIEATNQVARQQLQSSNMTVQLMQNVSESAQQSSVTTRNVAQQMERLAPLAGQLLTSVEVFKVREDRPPYVVVSEQRAYPLPNQAALNGSPAQQFIRSSDKDRGPRQILPASNTPAPFQPSVPQTPPWQDAARRAPSNSRNRSGR